MQHAARAPPDVRSSGISDHSRKDHAMSITGTAGTGARPRTSQFPWLPVTIGIGLVALILAGGLMVSLLTRPTTPSAQPTIVAVPAAALTNVRCHGTTTTDYDLIWGGDGTARVANDTGMRSTLWECPLVPGLYEIHQGCTPTEPDFNIPNNGTTPLQVQITDKRTLAMNCPGSVMDAEWVIRRVGDYPPSP